MGAVGGGAVNLVKGFYNSPKGYRFPGGLEAIRREAPKIGGSFAVWGGLFSAFDCTLVAIRRRRTPGTRSCPARCCCATASPPPADPPRLAGLAVIEGISIMLTRVTAPQPPQPAMIDVPPAAPAGAARGRNPPRRWSPRTDGERGRAAAPEETKQKSGGFWGIFGGGRKEEEDTAAPAVPSFGGELK